MEQCIVVVGLCAYRVESPSVEVAQFLNELITEVGALLILLAVVQIYLLVVSMLAS